MCARSLGLLVRKVNEARAEEMTSQLCDKATSVTTKKEQQRDVASIGLKTIVGEIRGLPVAASLAQTITKKMLLGMAKVSRWGQDLPGRRVRVAVVARESPPLAERQRGLISAQPPNLSTCRRTWTW